MNDNFKPTIQPTTKIPFFRRAVLQNFPFIEKDFDALTDYEFLCKVVEYLNKVIKQTNLMEDNENELVRVYNELYNYVENYFDNLDVQEEINNKLDEMVESGELQAIIFDKMQYVTYEMFGAKLDGETDDTNAIINAHNYANEHNLKVIQKRGTLYIPTASLNNCPVINTDCDFTGMKIKFDSNNDDNTVMIIADPNTLTSEKNDIQSINLSSGQISALSKTNTSPISFLEDYKNHYVVFETNMKIGTRTVGYGEDVFYSQGFEVNDLQQLTPNNMYADISQNASEVIMKYLPLNQKHLTIKLPEINIDGNVDNNPMILVMRNNVELLDCIITKSNYQIYTNWEQPLFRCRYCCNISIKNWVGQNISNEPTNTDITSYIIAIDKCYNVLYENNNLIKAHGCFVSYHTNFINFINNVCDRFDNHYGLFGNINITNNSFISYPAIINLGYGDGQVNIENCSFYKYDENGKQVSGICVDNRVDLTVMYAGTININNIEINGIKTTSNERYLTLLQWIPTKNENSIFPSFGNYNVPIINAKNIKFNAVGFYYRFMNVHNNNTSDVNYKLRTINLDSDTLSPYTSVLDFTQVDTDEYTKITLNGQRVQLISGTNEVPVTLLNNCNFRGNVASDKINLEILGNNNVIRNKIWRLKNLGNNNLGTSNEQITITDYLYNLGRLYITSGTIETLKSSGILYGDTITVNNGNASNEFHLKNLTVDTKLSISGAYVEIETSVTNNGQIYLTGNYMYSSVAGRFNNGTIHGNGNWAGDNSNIINTL